VCWSTCTSLSLESRTTLSTSLARASLALCYCSSLVERALNGYPELKKVSLKRVQSNVHTILPSPFSFIILRFQPIDCLPALNNCNGTVLEGSFTLSILGFLVMIKPTTSTKDKCAGSDFSILETVFFCSLFHRVGSKQNIKLERDNIPI
jgi:hypothetical protein